MKQVGPREFADFLSRINIPTKVEPHPSIAFVADEAIITTYPCTSQQLWCITHVPGISIIICCSGFATHLSCTQATAQTFRGTDIYGTLHHLDAIEVQRHLEHAWVVVCADFEDHLDALISGFNAGDEYETTEIDGRQYLLFMDPGC